MSGVMGDYAVVRSLASGTVSESDAIANLRVEVLTKVRLGYKPQGGIAVITATDSNWTEFYQAMILVDDE